MLNEPVTEAAFEAGERSAYTSLLRQCLRNLGYDENIGSDERVVATLILGRQEALACLRDVCDAWGDNDWTYDLSLADIIKNHLARHLERRDRIVVEKESDG